MSLVKAVARDVLRWAKIHAQVILSTIQSIISFTLLIVLSGVIFATTFNILHSGVLNG